MSFMDEDETPKVSYEDLLAHAHRLETEAVERYEELASAMRKHHNQEVADFFQKMAEVEGSHVTKMENTADPATLPARAPWEYDWEDPESPEAIPQDQISYRLTAQGAMRLAMAAERRAVNFFAKAAEYAADDKTRAIAEEMAQDERDHVVMIQQWMDRLPAGPDERGEDMDPPMDQD